MQLFKQYCHSGMTSVHHKRQSRMRGWLCVCVCMLWKVVGAVWVESWWQIRNGMSPRVQKPLNGLLNYLAKCWRNDKVTKAIWLNVLHMVMLLTRRRRNGHEHIEALETITIYLLCMSEMRHTVSIGPTPECSLIFWSMEGKGPPLLNVSRTVYGLAYIVNFAL